MTFRLMYLNPITHPKQLACRVSGSGTHPNFKKTTNAAYAASIGVVLVETYGDVGVSGLFLLK